MNIRKAVIGVSVVGVLLMGSLAFADTFSNAAEKWFINNCINPNKDSRRIEAAICDLRDRVMALEAKTPVPGPQGPKGDKGDPGQGTQYHVYDANNQDLGVLVSTATDSTTSVVTYLPSLHRTIYLHLGGVANDPNNSNAGTSDKVTILSSRIFYDRLNCTGQALAADIGNALSIYPSFDATPKYYSIVQNKDSERFVGSHLSENNDSGCVNVAEPNPAEYFKLQEVALPFNTPIAWPLEIR